MKPAVIIIGTNHICQVGGEKCATEDAEALRNLLLTVCQNWNLRGIAEEMSSEGLANYNGNNSVPFRVATELALPHRYCDPTSPERVLSGITGPGEVRLDAQRQGLSEDETAKRLVAEEHKREQYWLRKLQEQNVWPTLFVCGAKHVSHFKLLLDSAGHLAHVFIEDWTPHCNLSPHE